MSSAWESYNPWFNHAVPVTVAVTTGSAVAYSLAIACTLLQRRLPSASSVWMPQSMSKHPSGPAAQPRRLAAGPTAA